MVDREQMRAVFDAHAAAYGGLDIAFANAGVDPGAGFWNPAGHRNADGQIDTLDPARWDRTLSINLTGVFNTLREASRLMKVGGRDGSIIATSSNAAVVNEPSASNSLIRLEEQPSETLRRCGREMLGRRAADPAGRARGR